MSVPAIDEAAMLSPVQVRSLLERVREDTGGNQAVYPFLLSWGRRRFSPVRRSAFVWPT